MNIILEDGKYEYHLKDDGQYALRNGEPWRDLTGDKFIYCMAARIEQLTAERDARLTFEEHEKINTEDTAAVASYYVEQITKLTAERDAALADTAGAEYVGQLHYDQNLSLRREVTALKSALCDAKEALEYFLHPRVCQYSMPARHALATIDEVLK